ncbi:MAG: hypothetical protein ACTSWN_15785 [Promethearchaeota archaeon]
MDENDIKELVELIKRDYKDYIEKELDTDEEIAKKMQLKGYLELFLEYIEKYNDVVEFKSQIKELLQHLDKWDVYAYWFKEVRALVQGFKVFIEKIEKHIDSKSRLEETTPTSAETKESESDSDLMASNELSIGGDSKELAGAGEGQSTGVATLKDLVKSHKLKIEIKPVSILKATTQPQEEPGQDVEAAISTPSKSGFEEPSSTVQSSLEPTRAVSTDKMVAKKSEVVEQSLETPPSSSARIGSIKPIKLKPMSLHHVKAEKTTMDQAPGPELQIKSPAIEEPGSRITSAASVKSNVEKQAGDSLAGPVEKEGDTSIKVDMQGRASAPEPAKPVRFTPPSLKVIPKSNATIDDENSLTKSNIAPQKPSRSLLIPKPIKINVPDVMHINIDDELSNLDLSQEQLNAIKEAEAEINEAASIDGSIKLKEPLEDLLGQSTAQTTTLETKMEQTSSPRLQPSKSKKTGFDNLNLTSTGSSMAPSSSTQLEKNTIQEKPRIRIERPTPLASPPSSTGSTGTGDKHAIRIDITGVSNGSINAAAPQDVKPKDDTTQTAPTMSFTDLILCTKKEGPADEDDRRRTVAEKLVMTFGAKTFEPPSREKTTDRGKKKEKKGKADTGKESVSRGLPAPEPGGAIGLMQPQSPSVEPPNQINPPVDLFTSILEKKMKEKAPEPQAKRPSSISFFIPSNKPPDSSSYDQRVPSHAGKDNNLMLNTDERPSWKPVSMQIKPLGTSIDLNEIPTTRDGLLETLITLEGKQYSIERARNDLKMQLESKKIDENYYQQQLVKLKQEFDSIVAKIKVIKQKVKEIQNQ